MLEARQRAYATLVARGESPLSHNHYRARAGAEWRAISAMLHYLDAVEALLAMGLVDHATLERLLGRYISIWLDYLGPDLLRLDAYDGPAPRPPDSESDWHPLTAAFDRLRSRFP